MKGAGVLLAAILVVVLVPAHAAAQQTATSFAELDEREELTRGKDIVVTFRYEPSAGYKEVKAELVSLNASAIVVMVGKLPRGTTDLNIERREGRYGRHEIEIPEHRVQSIVLPPQGMSRAYGGLIGGAIGVGATALVSVACITANETGGGCALGDSSATALSLAMIGGGATVGALLTGKSDAEVLYNSAYLPAPLSSRFDWSVVPVLVSNQKSAVLTIEW
jgi:hypothetical protein